MKISRIAMDTHASITKRCAKSHSESTTEKWTTTELLSRNKWKDQDDRGDYRVKR